MTSWNEEEGSLRAYLLGETAPDEQRRIEERLLVDADYVERLLITEQDLMDDYVRDTLSERERELFRRHVLTTPERWRKLRKAKALFRYVNDAQPAPVVAPVSGWWAKLFGRQPLLAPAWRMAIAAMLVLGLTTVVWRVAIHQSLPAKASLTARGHAALQAAIPESPTETRITGFDWGPPSPTLGGQPQSASNNSLLNRAYSFFRDANDEQPGPDTLHALGQYYLAKGEWDTAIGEFEQAVNSAPANAKLRSDLGAAFLERAKIEQQNKKATSSYYLSKSLENLNLALELDGGLLEALFNRALCYERMGLSQPAEADWRAYLSRDSDSAWAVEANRHLERLENQDQKNSQSNQDSLGEFMSAYHSRDHAAAWRVVSQTRDLIAGRLIWWQLLNNFFNQFAAGQLAQADEWIESLQYVGKLEQQLGEEGGEPQGDPYLAELADFYSQTSRQQRAGLLEAHEQINEGLRRYLDNDYRAALDNYTQARQGFDRLRDRWEVLLADLLIGYCRVQTSELEQNPALLQQLVQDCEEKGYLWLQAHGLYCLGMTEDRLADHSPALAHTSEALQISEKISDDYNRQRSLVQIADQYKKLGNYDSATSYLNLCIDQISEVWPGDRQLYRTWDQLTQVLSARQLDDAAAAYASEALRVGMKIEDPTFTYVSYTHLALIHAKRQDYPEAIRLAHLGVKTAPSDTDKAYAALQLGHVCYQADDLSQALWAYDQSLDHITSAERASVAAQQAMPAKMNRLPALRYDAHKGRMFCLFARGEDGPAQEERAVTLELLEQHRDNIREEQNRNTFFNVEQSVYDAVINFEHRRQADNPAVFDSSEESRARSLLETVTTAQAGATKADGRPQDIRRPLKLAEVQQRLPERTRLLEYAALDDKLLICLVSKSEFSVKEVPIRLSELTDKVANFRRLIIRHTTEPRAEAQELYNLLIRPTGLSPANGTQLCIVADKALNSLPFDALISPDSDRYLVQDYQLTPAPSATIYIACSERTNHTTDLEHEHLLAVGDAAFESAPSTPPLPTTRQQVNTIARLYPSPVPAVLTDKRASAATVKQQMDKADVIQLASHYLVHPSDPMSSSLLLAREPDGSGGSLRAEEVARLNLRRRAPLVVLSACQSGVENYYNGEGMIGMSRVFITAGAPVVVASLWDVDVYATDELMISFHQHRKREKLSAVEALRRAQCDMLNNLAHRHPYYWAGFAAIGGHSDF